MHLHSLKTLVLVSFLIISSLPVVISSNSVSNGIIYVDDGGADYRSIVHHFYHDLLYSEDFFDTKNINSNLPDYFNWKDFGGQDWTTPAKHQLNPKWCGSCWIFAAIGTLESIINIREGSSDLDPDLSEQYVLSCLPEASYNQGKGCNGGYPFDAFRYIMDNSSAGNYCNGVILESCFPYHANDTIPCEEKCQQWKDFLIPIYNWKYWFPKGTIREREEIKKQIMQTGPVTTCMLWNDDIWDWGEEHHNPDEYYPFDIGGSEHDVIIVGWKDDPLIFNGGYWICKNSLGPEWGYDGFFNIVYGSLRIDSFYIVTVDYDPESYNWQNDPNPPNAPVIYGPSNGKVGEKYEYRFNALDPENDNLFYYIHWGDGTINKWIGPFVSNSELKINHTWSNKGRYTVMAIVMNSNGLISPWTILEVNIAKNKNNISSWLHSFLIEYPGLKYILERVLS